MCVMCALGCCGNCCRCRWRDAVVSGEKKMNFSFMHSTDCWSSCEHTGTSENSNWANKIAVRIYPASRHNLWYRWFNKTGKWKTHSADAFAEILVCIAACSWKFSRTRAPHNKFKIDWCDAYFPLSGSAYEIDQILDVTMPGVNINSQSLQCAESGRVQYSVCDAKLAPKKIQEIMWEI